MIALLRHVVLSTTENLTLGTRQTRQNLKPRRHGVLPRCRRAPIDAWLTLQGGRLGEPAPAELTRLRWVARLAVAQEQTTHIHRNPLDCVVSLNPEFLCIYVRCCTIPEEPCAQGGARNQHILRV